MSTMAQFPTGFLWGAATASYQIEGAARDGGRGESVWDVFSHTEGKVANGHTGDVACDHYHRLDDDVTMMADLGLQSYRFSISWSRVMPDGRGSVNQEGVDFYQRLVDRLLEHDIVPCPTLFHWDLPQGLEELGGFRNRDTVSWFGDYAALMVRRARRPGRTCGRRSTNPGATPTSATPRASTRRGWSTRTPRSPLRITNCSPTALRCRPCGPNATTCNSAS